MYLKISEKHSSKMKWKGGVDGKLGNWGQGTTGEAYDEEVEASS